MTVGAILFHRVSIHAPWSSLSLKKKNSPTHIKLIASAVGGGGGGGGGAGVAPFGRATRASKVGIFEDDDDDEKEENDNENDNDDNDNDNGSTKEGRYHTCVLLFF